MILVNLSGKEFEIRFDYNSICAIEEKTGKAAQTLFNTEISNFCTIRAFLWGGLRHANKEMSLEKAGTLIQNWIKDGKEIEDLAFEIGRALAESEVFGKSKDDSEDETETKETEGEQSP